MMKNVRVGFTLAEVLTTLMVIGVVAAMTIPTLLNSTDDQQKKVAYKKAMSVLSQGTQLMVAKEAECVVGDSKELAACFKNNVLSGTVLDTGSSQVSGANSFYVLSAATDGTGDNIVTSDGMAYHFIYNGSDNNTYRSLDDICGEKMAGTTASDWDGSKAACKVIVDINGTAKGSKGFTSIAASSNAFTDASVGSDQFALMITGTGIKPVYVSNGTSSGINKGYGYLYGTSAASPITTGT